MARAGCGHFTSTNGLEGEDVILRQRRPEKVAVCGSSPSAADGSVLATARQRCAAKSRTSSTRRSAHRRLVEAAAATAAGNLGVAITSSEPGLTTLKRCPERHRAEVRKSASVKRNN